MPVQLRPTDPVRCQEIGKAIWADMEARGLTMLERACVLESVRMQLYARHLVEGLLVELDKRSSK